MIYDKKTQTLDLSKIKFQPLDFGVLLNDSKVSLPIPLNTRFFGKAGVRTKVTIKNYHIYGEGEARRESYGDLVNFEMLRDIKTIYFIRENYASYIDYVVLYYSSKDDYINIRENPNGKIVAKISKSDMIENNGVLLYINGEGIDFENLNNFESSWHEVFYLPPNTKDGSQAIHGFVYSSQVEVKIKNI